MSRWKKIQKLEPFLDLTKHKKLVQGLEFTVADIIGASPPNSKHRSVRHRFNFSRCVDIRERCHLASRGSSFDRGSWVGYRSHCHAQRLSDHERNRGGARPGSSGSRVLREHRYGLRASSWLSVDVSCFGVFWLADLRSTFDNGVCFLIDPFNCCPRRIPSGN